ncbi:S-adenosyl-L-methionine-dependent methyltransferase [Crucibulum laeve]|uniref:S-adenosyl-L-methionine-dependent methyltransferase n=1 Tax=Crucibulum laeve TaxID=68775 RepID=A0A5C3M967_9AGAR|nr:S-adenosyl-L-methionine-dependent methyltransferase [Crucibulum laeve]
MFDTAADDRLHYTAGHDEDINIEVDDDARSTASLPPFSPAPSELGSTRTSHEIDTVSMRSCSPTPSVWSVTSSLRAQAYKHEYGRGLNNYSEVYRLPADDEELDRLNKQHLIFMEAMNGKYAPPMEEIMADDVPGERKACLDLGCGSGCWIMDVARDFPNCDAVAVDLVPMQSLLMPPNCRSEVDDINLGLEHFYGDFNVVHARLISSGIKDYAGLIDHISKVLRPGGMIDLSEFDFHAYDQNYQRIELGIHEIGPPWWPRWLAFANAAARNLGGNVDAATHLYDWVANHPAFEEVIYREFWLPGSPWIKGDAFQQRIGNGMRDDIFAFMKSGRPLLLGNGLQEHVLDQIEREAMKELQEAKIPSWIRLQCVYGRKKGIHSTS